MDRKAQRLDVTFRDPNISGPGETIEEGTDYVNAAEFTVDKPEAASDDKCCSFFQCFPPLICWLILIGILVLRIYCNLLYVDHETTSLKAEKENFTEKIKELEAEKTNLTGQIQNMEAEKKNLTEQIQNMEAEWIKLNVSRAQWSINAYCRQEISPRTCQPCEKGWLHSQSSCYAVNDLQPAGRRNWEEAREDCRGKGSDLAVVADDIEKKNISDHYSWASSGDHGYWIGLRAEHGKWKWVDGSDLAKTSWMTDAATDGRCVISVKDKGWKSVSCDGKQRWICEKAALSV